MNEHHLRRMADDIVKEFGLDDFVVNEAVEVMKNYWKDKLAIVWHDIDIIDHAKNMGVELSTEQLANVMSSLQSDHDCNNGITWDVIEATIEFEVDDD